MTSRLARVLRKIALAVLIVDSLYILFMFLAFPLLRGYDFSTFLGGVAQEFGVSQRGFCIHWILGLILATAVLVCAAGSFTHFAFNRTPLVVACCIMIAFTIVSGFYLRGSLGLRHTWRIALCAVSVTLFLITKTNSVEHNKPNNRIEATS